MIGQSFVFVCAAVALVAGSCCQSPLSQGLSQQIVSVQPSFSRNVFSSGASFAVPVVSGSVSNGFSSLPVSSYGSSLSGSALVSGESLELSGSSLSGSLLSSGFGSGVTATDGPETAPLPVVQAPAVTLPAVEGPVVTLSSQPIPAPTVLGQRCICTKTIVKPQVYQRTVTVPKIQRYLKRTVTPVVENVSYKSTPVNQGSSSGSEVVAVSSGSGSLSVSSGLGYRAASSGSRYATVSSVPRYAAVSSGLRSGSLAVSSGSGLSQGYAAISTVSSPSCTC